MSALQLFPDQPIASSSTSGGLRPQIIIKFPLAVQPVSAIPLSNTLPSVPPVAKTITSSSLPSNVQSIYDDAYLANLSLEVLEQVPDGKWHKIFALYPSSLSCKGKEVICDPVDVNVKMEAPDAMESMDLDHPEDVPPASAPIPAVPAPIPMKPAVVCTPSSLVAELLSSSSKTMMEQDLWTLADGLVQGIFNELKEQLKHPSSEPPALFLNCSLTQFIESLLMINLSSASIIDAQQDELFQAYWEYQSLSQKTDHLETKNLHLKEQVSSQDSQLKEKDKKLTCLKSFMRHFRGDAQSLETQLLRGTLEGQESEIEEDLQSQDTELAQLQQLFELVQGQFAAASPSKPSSSSS
ncbi:hypothetical protein GYMLUDRAFT_247503 [Collybiopsis luxurians FD-317 M1]|uniref:Uncharacterized protein n=1 Tax=Collybiopsis luxurians FD-317 M1 TaxID=944289 RepID=A0A0D0CF57_9AGAR|nr:hypothetical protein GYMLUDRAFT_247503 [Collybiopsis luxurians FD-317 M1]